MSKKPVCMSCGAEALPGWTNLVPVAKGAYLCRGCVEATLGYFEARGSPAAAPAQTAVPTDIPTPGDLLQTLDHAVVSQQAAKQLLAVAAWKHLQRNAGNTAAPRAHVLLYGPTGCGKTHLARTMAALMDVPFVAEDATTFSAAELLAAEAYKRGSGARGLRGRLERIVTGLLLAGVDDVHITADLLREEGDGHGLVADRGA